MKLKKGDKVKIMTGKDGGKEGAIEKVFSDDGSPRSGGAGKVVVAGLNVYKRHMKPKADGQKGSIVEFNRPMQVASVALICPKCKEITRVGYKLTAKEKVRICRKCEQEI